MATSAQMTNGIAKSTKRVPPIVQSSTFVIFLSCAAKRVFNWVCYDCASPQANGRRLTGRPIWSTAVRFHTRVRAKRITRQIPAPKAFETAAPSRAGSASECPTRSAVSFLPTCTAPRPRQLLATRRVSTGRRALRAPERNHGRSGFASAQASSRARGDRGRRSAPMRIVPAVVMRGLCQLPRQHRFRSLWRATHRNPLRWLDVDAT